ncbi:MAG: hypothetical protein WAN86_09340, partial [Hyphomicrobiaceae bacterium]
DLAPSMDGVLARPDEPSGGNNSWREVLAAYNTTGKNPCHLLPAYRLYTNSVYGALVGRFGRDNVFILSAGWGLVSATYLLPDYDITFSQAAEPHKRRRKIDVFKDWCMLPDDGDDALFLGGKDYLPLFQNLTLHHAGTRIVVYNSLTQPELPVGFKAVRYKTTTRTNWHYECVRALLSNEFKV